jgi:hypothetical protein
MTGSQLGDYEIRFPWRAKLGLHRATATRTAACLLHCGVEAAVTIFKCQG